MGQDPRTVDAAHVEFFSGSCLELAERKHQRIDSFRSVSLARIPIWIMNDILCHADGPHKSVASLDRRLAFGYQSNE